MVPRIASKTKRDAAATYAQPKNGFFPPIHETVEMTMDLVPEYGLTGKSITAVNVAPHASTPSVHCHVREHRGRKEPRTHIGHNLVRPRLECVSVVPRPELRECW